jgi:hypothetical protein
VTSRTRSFLVAGTILVGAIALSPRVAEARGHVGFHGAVVVRGFLGGPFDGPYYGYPYCGFSPHWVPCYGGYGSNAPYGPNGPTGFRMGVAAPGGIGSVDLDVEPGAAEVWIDGRFVAEARDLDGTPGVLWLENGPHRLVIYKGGYRTFDEDVSVHPGQKLDLKIRLERRPSAGTAGAPRRRPSGRACSASGRSR